MKRVLTISYANLAAVERLITYGTVVVRHFYFDFDIQCSCRCAQHPFFESSMHAQYNSTLPEYVSHNTTCRVQYPLEKSTGVD